MTSSPAYEVNPAQLIACSQQFDPIVQRAISIAKDLAAALAEDPGKLGKQGPRDIFEVSFAQAHDNLAAETERQICLLPERIHEFGKSFLLAARLYQAGDQQAIDRLSELTKPVVSSDGPISLDRTMPSDTDSG